MRAKFKEGKLGSDRSELGEPGVLKVGEDAAAEQESGEVPFFQRRAKGWTGRWSIRVGRCHESLAGSPCRPH